jgi:DAACS family dicarboxylate/amino acid:cation (Na+ or H+) symporter
VQTFVSIVPRNPIAAMANMDMLGVIFFALLVGIGLTCIPQVKADAVLTLLDAVNDLMVVIIGWAMRLAPYGVFALIFSVTARFGFDLLKPLGWYVVVVLAGLAIQMFGVLSVLLATLSRINPLTFFRKVRDVMITAFSTSSSNATLPTSIRTAELELGIAPSIAGFVLPLGATMNMNGTALFEGVTVMFLAQVFGIDLTLGDQIIVVVLSVMTAIGAAGVPGGSLPLLAMVLTTVNVPAEGIALILGVDRLLDMCRTTLNVIGDLAAATYVARSESLSLPDTAN